MYTLSYNDSSGDQSHAVASIQAAMAHLWFIPDVTHASLHKDNQPVGRIVVTTQPEAPKNRKIKGYYLRWFMNYIPYGRSTPTMSVRHPLKDTA